MSSANPFLDGLTTVMRFWSTSSSYKNRILRVPGCQSSRVVLIIRFITFYKQCFNLLTDFWIDRISLLAKSWQSISAYQPRKREQ